MKYKIIYTKETGNYSIYIPLDKTSFGFNNGQLCKRFIADVKEHGLSIVEGADVIEPDYVALRTGPDGYAPLAEQLDMQFKNDGSWEAHVQSVKDKFPKTITGGTTIAPLPQWVLDLVEETNV